MFITKKHISRRTVLRGAGAALALPFLESMLPAATPELPSTHPAKTDLSLNRSFRVFLNELATNPT